MSLAAVVVASGCRPTVQALPSLNCSDGTAITTDGPVVAGPAGVSFHLVGGGSPQTLSYRDATGGGVQVEGRQEMVTLPMAPGEASVGCDPFEDITATVTVTDPAGHYKPITWACDVQVTGIQSTRQPDVSRVTEAAEAVLGDTSQQFGYPEANPVTMATTDDSGLVTAMVTIDRETLTPRAISRCQ